MTRLKTFVTALVLALGLIAPTAVVAPAHAAVVQYGGNANIYLVVRDRVCGHYTHKVRALSGDVSTGRNSWTVTHWDAGDNIVYPSVRLHNRHNVTLKARCYKKMWGVFWVEKAPANVIATIYPTSHKQTLWVG